MVYFFLTVFLTRMGQGTKASLGPASGIISAALGGGDGDLSIEVCHDRLYLKKGFKIVLSMKVKGKEHPEGSKVHLTVWVSQKTVGENRAHRVWGRAPRGKHD